MIILDIGYGFTADVYGRQVPVIRVIWLPRVILDDCARAVFAHADLVFATFQLVKLM